MSSESVSEPISFPSLFELIIGTVFSDSSLSDSALSSSSQIICYQHPSTQWWVCHHEESYLHDILSSKHMVLKGTQRRDEQTFMILAASAVMEAHGEIMS